MAESLEPVRKVAGCPDVRKMRLQLAIAVIGKAFDKGLS